MDRESAKVAAKGMMESYLHSKGIDTRKNFPCLNPQHTDKNPSMSFNPKDNRVKCFACDASYDIFDLVGIDYNISDTKEKFARTYEILNISVDQRQPQQQIRQSSQQQPKQNIGELAAKMEKYVEECAARVEQTQYFEERGIPADVVKAYKLGFDPCYKAGGGQSWAAVIIPTGPVNFVARNTNPHAEAKDRYRKKGETCILNEDILYTSTRPICVTEGELDALSIIAAGGEALALGSVANKDKFLDVVRQHKPAAPLVLALDNDTSGNKCADDIATELQQRGISFYRLNLYGNYKDANEALTSNPAAFRAEVDKISTTERLEAELQKARIDEYVNTSAAAHLQNFVDGIAAAANTPSISTGFAALDSVLDGGLYEGLYIIGAISSLGKTTLALQIIDQIAAAGYDCLVFSLEMARNELMSKSISRLTLTGTLRSGGDTRNAKTSRGITAGERYAHYNPTEQQLIQQSITDYAGYASRIYIYEGIGDIGVNKIREVIQQHKEIMGRAPVVLVDYLQILAPYDPRATDKQNTDKAVLELKRISRDYKTPVIGISSFNRDNYSAPVSMVSFKESGAIEYSSDVLIGLQLEGVGVKGFDVDEAKAAIPRRIELKILKNRNGSTGGMVLYNYYPQFNYFEEQGIVKRDGASAQQQPATQSSGVKVDYTKAKKGGKKALAEAKKAQKQQDAAATEAEEAAAEQIKINDGD